MQAVRYARPSSVEEAVELLERGGAGARVLAGGTDLIVLARERRIDVDLFVDVKALAAADGDPLRPGGRAHDRRGGALLSHRRSPGGTGALSLPDRLRHA